MTNSYDVDHGLSQDAPGPLEPVELAQQPGAAPATGNTARDQEMYAAGIEVGEANTKHNAAIRSGVPEGWKLVTKKTCYALMHDGAVIATLAGPESEANAAIIARMLAAPSCPTCNDQGAVGNILTAEPCPDCAAPGVSTVEDERQAFEAWAKRKKMPLARIGQQYDDFWVDHAWNGWQARAALDAPAAGDARAALNIEAAAKAMAECMDYPWAHMPEQGRATMREHAQTVIRAASQQQER